MVNPTGAGGSVQPNMNTPNNQPVPANLSIPTDNIDLAAALLDFWQHGNFAGALQYIESHPDISSSPANAKLVTSFLDAYARGDPSALSSALDNLIANLEKTPPTPKQMSEILNYYFIHGDLSGARNYMSGRGVFIVQDLPSGVGAKLETELYSNNKVTAMSALYQLTKDLGRLGN